MALPSTLYRFRIDLADVERDVYEKLDLRVAMHPSETAHFLLTRLLAYALSYRAGLEFSPGGLSDPDAPGISLASPRGGYQIWIEIGNPSARKLHKATKQAETVAVYTYKDPENLVRDIDTNRVHRGDEIDIVSFAPSFLNSLESWLGRDNDWSILMSDGTLSVSRGGQTESIEPRRLRATAR